MFAGCRCLEKNLSMEEVSYRWWWDGGSRLDLFWERRGLVLGV